MTSTHLDEILSRGESIYLSKFKDKLEKESSGKFAAIDVLTEDYVLGQNKLEALTEAKIKFNDRLVYVLQIGTLEAPTVNYRGSKHAAWST